MEVLIGASLLVVMFAYFTPPIATQKGKAELNRAVDRVEDTIAQAQRTARLKHSDVIMTITPGSESEMDSIIISLPSYSEPEPTEKLSEVIEFPEGIRLVSERQRIRFDFRGEVDQPTQLTVVSNTNENLDKRVLIY